MTAGRRLPTKLAPLLFGGLLSGLMSLIVSGVSTLRAIGFVQHFWTGWLSAWLMSWAVAFPVVLLVAPFVRKIVARVTEPPASAARSHSGA
jgi:hypothetical protein